MLIQREGSAPGQRDPDQLLVGLHVCCVRPLSAPRTALCAVFGWHCSPHQAKSHSTMPLTSHELP